MFAAVLKHLRTSNVWLELHAALQPISSSRRAANGCHPTVITAVYPPGAAVQRLSGSHLQTKCFAADISSPLLHVRFLSAYSSVALLCSITDSLLSRPFIPPDSRRSALRNRRKDGRLLIAEGTGSWAANPSSCRRVASVPFERQPTHAEIAAHRREVERRAADQLWLLSCWKICNPGITEVGGWGGWGWCRVTASQDHSWNRFGLCLIML